MRIFDDCERAAEWVSGTADRVRLERIEALAGAALLALCLAAPAEAAVDKGPEPLGRNTATSWTLIVGDPEEAPQTGTSPHPALADQPPQIVPMPPRPPPGDVLDAVGVLRLSCPKWQAGQTPGYETEAHVCQLLAGHDTSYNEGELAGSRVAVALLASLWLFGCFVQRVSAPLDRLWKRIGNDRAGMP